MPYPVWKCLMYGTAQSLYYLLLGAVPCSSFSTFCFYRFKVKKILKDLAANNRLEYWREYIKPLIQQGNMLKLIHLENMDLTWKSIIFDLPRRVLSFAVRSSIDYLPTFCNLRTWGKRSQTKCKLCGNYETLLHVLNNCTVSLNQGRYTWRAITPSLSTCSLLWKVSLSLQIMTSPFLVTSADIRPLEVPSQLTSLFLSSSLTWSFTTKRTILYTWFSWQCHLKKTSRKLMIVRLRNIETLFLIF